MLRLRLVIYCAGSGFAGAVAGAAASLLASGTTAKVIVWAAVTAVVAVIAGWVYPVP